MAVIEMAREPPTVMSKQKMFDNTALFLISPCQSDDQEMIAWEWEQRLASFGHLYVRWERETMNVLTTKHVAQLLRFQGVCNVSHMSTFREVMEQTNSRP